MHKAHCPQQEYWMIGRTHCECGAAYNRASVGAQHLEHRASGPVDVLEVHCGNCGHDSAFEFDISSFFGKTDIDAFEELLRDKEQVWRMYVESQHRIEAIFKYMDELAQERDFLAIEYIAEAAQQFLVIAQSRPESGPR
jgi:hypothetical protein